MVDKCGTRRTEPAWLHPLDDGCRSAEYHFPQALDGLGRTTLAFRPGQKAMPLDDLFRVLYPQLGGAYHGRPFAFRVGPVVTGIAQALKGVHVAGGLPILGQDMVLD